MSEILKRHSFWNGESITSSKPWIIWRPLKAPAPLAKSDEAVNHENKMI